MVIKLKIAVSAPIAIKKHSKETFSKLKKTFQHTVSYISHSVNKLSNMSKLSNLTLKIIKFATLILGEENVSFLLPVKTPLKTVKNVTGTLKLADKSYGLINVNSKTSSLQVAHKVTSFVSSVLKTIKYCGSLGLIQLGKFASAIGKIPVFGIITKMPLGIVIDVLQFVVNVLGVIEDGQSIFALGNNIKKTENKHLEWEKQTKEIEELIRLTKESANIRDKLIQSRKHSLINQPSQTDPFLSQTFTIEKIPLLPASKMESAAELTAEIQLPAIELAANPVHPAFVENELEQIAKKRPHIQPKLSTVTVGHVVDLQYDQSPEKLYDRFDHEKMGHFDHEKKQQKSSKEIENFKNHLNSRDHVHELANDIVKELTKTSTGEVNVKNLSSVNDRMNLFEIEPNIPDKVILNAGEVLPKEFKETAEMEKMSAPAQLIAVSESLETESAASQKPSSIDLIDSTRTQAQLSSTVPSVFAANSMLSVSKEQPVNSVEAEVPEEIKQLQSKVDQQTVLFNEQIGKLKAFCCENIAKANSYFAESRTMPGERKDKWQSKVMKWEKILNALEEGELSLLDEINQQFALELQRKKNSIEMFKQVKIQRILSLIYRAAKVVLAAASIFLFFSGIGTTLILAGYITFAILTYAFGIFKFFWKEMHTQQLHAFKKFELSKV